MKKIILLSTVLIFVGCVTTKQAMDSWLGSTKQNLMMSWGAPTRVSDDGNGGQILVYATQIHINPIVNSYYDSNNNLQTTSTGAINYWDYKMFYVNKSGIVYHYLIQRESIPPMQIDLNLYRR